eukprot:759128-Hanusia_phi.AAC.2
MPLPPSSSASVASEMPRASSSLHVAGVANNFQICLSILKLKEKFQWSERLLLLRQFEDGDLTVLLRGPYRRPRLSARGDAEPPTGSAVGRQRASVGPGSRRAL